MRFTVVECGAAMRIAMICRFLLILMSMVSVGPMAGSDALVDKKAGRESPDASGEVVRYQGKTKQTIHNELLSRLLLTNASLRLDTPPSCTHLPNYTALPIEAIEMEGTETTFLSELIVLIDLKFEQIMDVDERLKRIISRLIIAMHWKDCRFTWNPEEEAGILEVHVTDLRANNIFLPTILLRETLESAIEWRIGRTLHVDYKGLLSLSVRTDVISSCNIDTYLYPFDVHECRLTFEATEDSIHTLALTLLRDVEAHERQPLEKYGSPHLNKSWYVPSDHWEFIEHTHTLTNFTDDLSGETFSRVQHRFRIRRHPSYHLVNVVLPCVITMLIASVIFVIPPGGSDKMGLCVSILLSLIVFTQLMFDRMPETGSTLPMISQYFLFCNGVVALSCVVSVIGMILVNKAEEQISQPIVRFIFLRFFGRVLLPAEFIKLLKSKPVRVSSSCYDNVTINIDKDANGDCSNMTRRNGRNVSEWFLVAVVIDRLFFIAHIGSTMILLLAYLITAYGAWLNSVRDTPPQFSTV